jgi:hypothetical protein
MRGGNAVTRNPGNMGVAYELLKLDAQIFSLQAKLKEKPEVEGTKELEALLKLRETLLLKLESEERERILNKMYKHP